MKDKRIKMCPNSECSRYKKHKYSVEDTYCSECREELVFVCAKCGKPIADEGPQHKLCRSCVARAADKKDKVVNAATKTAGTVASVLMASPVIEKAPQAVSQLKKVGPVAAKMAGKIIKR